MADQDRSEAPPERVGLRAFRAHPKRYLRLAREGRSLAVTSHGAVIAEIHPPSRPEPPQRRPGALKGRIRLAEEADEVTAAGEGREA